MNVLILAPHTDDGELGCGATISKLINAKCTVHYIAFSYIYRYNAKVNNLTEECYEALKELGVPENNVRLFNFESRNFLRDRQKILDCMIKLNKDYKPDLIFTPMKCDIHQDHQTITNEAIRAFKHCSLLGYEMVWNNLNPTLNVYIEVSEMDVQKKIEAFKKYESQNNRDYYKNSHLLCSLAQTRGLSIGVEFAEAFECIKLINPIASMLK